MSHRVQIGVLETKCEVTGPHARRESIRSAVDLSCRESLPRALTQDLDQALSGLDGVIRIRRLDLTCQSLDPLGPALARHISGEIIKTLRAALAEAQGHLSAGRARAVDMRHWPDHAAFMASFVLFRLGLTADAPWPYRDFAALDTLSGQEAAVEILAARPETLAAIARHADANALMARVVTALAPNAAANPAAGLLARLETDQDAMSPEALAALWQAHSGRFDAALEQIAMAEIDEAALHLALKVLAAAPPLKSAQEVRQLCRLARTFAALKALAPRLAKLSHGSWPARLHALTHDTTLPPNAARAATVLARQLDQDGGDRLLDLLAEGRFDPPGPTDQTPNQNAGKDALSTGPIQSGYAGIALLLPSFMALGGAALTGPERAAALLAALPTDQRADAARDPGIDLMLPYDPHEQPRAAADWPRPTPAPDPTPKEPSDLWSRSILTHFADHLPGLAGSSPGYLAMQFLARPGTVERTEDSLFVTLSPLPLSIVLTMGGHFGPRGALPWLDGRKLVLSLKKGA